MHMWNLDTSMKYDYQIVFFNLLCASYEEKYYDIHSGTASYLHNTNQLLLLLLSDVVERKAKTSGCNWEICDQWMNLL